MKRLLPLVLFAVLATAGFARIGDPLEKFRARFGKGPDPQSPRGKAVWFIEVEDGVLVYTVTVDDKGRSIAEGIKPLKRAQFPREIAQEFIDDQLALVKDSKTARRLRPGEQYTFAGQAFVCGKDEFVVVDEPRDLLVVWEQGGIPSVMALTRAVLQPSGK